MPQIPLRQVVQSTGKLNKIAVVFGKFLEQQFE